MKQFKRASHCRQQTNLTSERWLLGTVQTMATKILLVCSLEAWEKVKTQQEIGFFVAKQLRTVTCYVTARQKPDINGPPPWLTARVIQSIWEEQKWQLKWQKKNVLFTHLVLEPWTFHGTIGAYVYFHHFSFRRANWRSSYRRWIPYGFHSAQSDVKWPSGAPASALSWPTRGWFGAGRK